MAGRVPSNRSIFSKCFLAFLMFTRVAADAVRSKQCGQLLYTLVWGARPILGGKIKESSSPKKGLAPRLLYTYNYTDNSDIYVLFLIDSRMSGSDMMTITYVFGVKMSMKEAKHEFLTSILWNWAWSLLEWRQVQYKPLQSKV